MANEPDGTGREDTLEVIRKLLQKLEEAASADGGRSTDRNPSAAPIDPIPSPRRRILSAEERLVDDRGIKACIFGKSGVADAQPAQMSGLDA